MVSFVPGNESGHPFVEAPIFCSEADAFASSTKYVAKGLCQQFLLPKLAIFIFSEC